MTASSRPSGGDRSFSSAAKAFGDDQRLRRLLADPLTAKLIGDLGDRRAQVSFARALAIGAGIDVTDDQVTALLEMLDTEDGFLGDPVELLRTRLKLNVGDRTLERVRKHGGRRGSFDLVLRDGRVIDLGSMPDVLDPRRVQASVADVAKVVIAETTRPKWARFAEAIVKAAEDDGEGPADTTHGWLADYRRFAGHLDLGDPKQLREAIEQRDRQAFIDQRGRFWVHTDHLVRWLKRDLMVQVTSREIGTRLREAGFRRAQLSVRVRGHKHPMKRTLWHSPDDYALPRRLQWGTRDATGDIAGQTGQRDRPIDQGKVGAANLGAGTGQRGTNRTLPCEPAAGGPHQGHGTTAGHGSTVAGATR